MYIMYRYYFGIWTTKKKITTPDVYIFIYIKNGAIRFSTVEITNLAKGYWFYPDDV